MINETHVLSVKPIGYFQTSQTRKYAVPRQATLLTNYEGIIQLNSHCHFEQALEGLEGFERIWILFHFHLHSHWKPKVLPPRGGKKRGVFATRSPHRPNLIGLSCVELKEIKGLSLYIANHDLVDGTPVLDIKPYINYADSFHCKRQGWLDELPIEQPLLVKWSELADQQFAYLAAEWNCSLKEEIAMRLQTNPFPYSSNRVKKTGKNWYQLAYQTWRVHYQIIEECLVRIYLSSGYDKETLEGRKESRWEDLPVHQAFHKQFSEQINEFKRLNQC